MKQQTTNCLLFKDKNPAHPALDDEETGAMFGYNFPAAEKYMGQSVRDYVEKLHEEANEVVDADMPRDRIIELMDVIHVAETAIRTLAERYRLDTEELAAEVYQKNSERGYYSK